MVSIKSLLREVSPLNWFFAANGLVLLGLGLYAYLSPGYVGVYQLKSYALILTVLGLVLLLPAILGVLKAAGRRH